MAIITIGHSDSDGYYATHCAVNYAKEKHPTEDYTYYHVQYGEAFPFSVDTLTRRDSIFIVDFSYSADILENLASRCGKLVVLDHHKTAQEQLEGLQERLDKGCDATIVFDMTKSGALLAFEYFNPGEEAPFVCKLVNDRDLWKFEFGDFTRAFESYIRTAGQPKLPEWWDEFDKNEAWLWEAIGMGDKFLMYEREVVRRFISNPNSHAALNVMITGPSHTSESYACAFYEGMGILHSELAEGFYSNEDIRYDMTLEWRKKGKDLLVFSLRSPKVDVSVIAKHFGGGGHKAAAGFSMEFGAGLDFVKNLYAQRQLIV